MHETSKQLKSRGFILALTLLTCLKSQAVSSQDWGAIRENAAPAVVFIETIRRNTDGTNREVFTSTGFIFTPDGHVLTVAHAVPEAKPGQIVEYWGSPKTRHGHKYKLSVVIRDPLDVALLLLPPLTWPAIEISGDSVRADTRLYVLGFPGNSDLASADGLLSNMRGELGRWQTTLPLNPGHSGGPVFDKTGRVVGIAAGGREFAQGVTFVIPSNLFGAVLQYVPKYALNTDSRSTGASTTTTAEPRVESVACPEITITDWSKYPVEYRRIRQCN